MKSYSALILVLALTSCGAARTAEQLPAFIHGTYHTEQLLTSIELSNPGYEDFDFIYHMGMPDWTALDFDCPRDSAIAYADRFDYAQGERNMPLVPQMISKAHEAGARVLLCLGGQQEFVPFVQKPQMLETLADYLVRLVENNDFDGVDIDWEITLDKPLYVNMMENLRRNLDELSAKNGRTYYLTSALSIDHVFDKGQADRLMACLDWVNIMSYDMCAGIWATTPSHNTSMAVLKEKLRNWTNFTRDKICLGLANYGFYYIDRQPGEPAPGPLRDYGGSYITYKKFFPLLSQGWTEEYDPEAQVSYYFSPDHKDFVTMENPESMRTKIEWIYAQNFRGVFWWEFHHDYTHPKGDGSRGAHALIDVVTEYLGNQ